MRAMDTAAFGRLVETHYAAVAAVAFAITRDLALAEDVAQDTFVAAWGALDSLKDPERVRPWLCGIARNQSKNALRTRRREVAEERDVIDTKQSVVDEKIDRERARELEAALAEIPAAYREPLVLFYWEEQSVDEVASTLSISAQAAQKRISRARSYLHEELATRFDTAGRARKRASAAAAAAVLAVIASTGGVAKAATTTKGSTMWIGKALLLATAGAVMVTGVALWTGHRSDAVPRPAPAAVATSTAGSGAAIKAAPSTPTLPATAPPAREFVPGEPAPSPTFGDPAGYELTVLAPTRVVVELAGGKSAAFLWNDPPAPDLTRHIRGRVVDGRGRGISGAVVVGGAKLHSLGGSLQGEAGAVTAADGSFDMQLHVDTAAFAMALHGSGWSAPVAIGAGRSDIANLELHAGSPGTLAFHVTQGGEPREANIIVQQPGLMLVLATTVKGEFRLPRLAPGSYDVRASSMQPFAGGAATEVAKRVDVTERVTTDVPLALPTGTVIAVTAKHATELSTIEYFLSPGSEKLSLGELSKRARSGDVMDTLFGGQDVDRVMQFHDVKPGTYTLCIDARAHTDAREHLPLDCRTLEVAGDKPVQELEVKLP